MRRHTPSLTDLRVGNLAGLHLLVGASRVEGVQEGATPDSDYTYPSVMTARKLDANVTQSVSGEARYLSVSRHKLTNSMQRALRW